MQFKAVFFVTALALLLGILGPSAPIWAQSQEQQCAWFEKGCLEKLEFNDIYEPMPPNESTTAINSFRSLVEASRAFSRGRLNREGFRRAIKLWLPYVNQPGDNSWSSLNFNNSNNENESDGGLNLSIPSDPTYEIVNALNELLRKPSHEPLEKEFVLIVQVFGCNTDRHTGQFSCDKGLFGSLNK